MTTTFVIEANIGEWRTALLDAEDIPVEVTYIGDTHLDLTDMVATAKVTKVDGPNDMAFLTLPNGEVAAINYRRAQALATKDRKDLKTISDCVTEGQYVTVQVIGMPNSTENKAIALTAKPKLVGRYIVLEEGKPRLNFSNDIKPHGVGALRAAIESLAVDCSIIVRSKAGDVPVKAVVEEITWLSKAFVKTAIKPTVHFQASNVERALLNAPDGDGPIIIEDVNTLLDAKKLAQSRWPDLLPRLTQWQSTESMMEHYGVNDAIEEATSERINLPSGGWISLHETPALTAIDVNMGRALKNKSAADARHITNLEAALASLFHIRFQNIGGLIVIDFIDNNSKGSVAALMKLIDTVIKDDPVPIQHTGLSAFGLLQFNRKRRGRSLRDHLLTIPTPREKARTAALRLLRLAKTQGLKPEPGILCLQAPAKVIKWLETHKNLLEAVKISTAREILCVENTTLSCYIKKNI